MNERTPLELYAPHAYRIVMLLSTVVALTACLTYTIGHFSGAFSDVPVRNIVILDVSGLIYLTVCIFLNHHAFDGNGELRPCWTRGAKALLCLLTVIHWNMCSYLIPLRAFWGYGPLFLLITACLLDEKLVITEGVALLVSAVASWFILPDGLGVPGGAHLIRDVWMRIECLVLTYSVIYVLTRLARTLLTRTLERVFEYDPLTKLRNCRSMDGYLDAAGASGEPYTVAVIDVDDLKSLNTACGYRFGDTVIKRVADILQQNVRGTDMVFRLRSDVFLILFGCSAADALPVAKRILDAIRAESFSPKPDATRSVSVSIGLCDLSAATSKEHAVDSALSNVALGKRSGKGCIVCSEPDGTVRYTE